MRIQKIISQNRRDFFAVYECEHCNATTKDSGYDDDNFHENVIPAMTCQACGQKANKEDYEPLTPRYSAGVVI